jgi:hypothetical protein
MFNRLIFGDLKHGHNARDFVPAKNAHQIIFERDIKARRAGISLTTGATTELIVDPARVVTFCPEYMESTGSYYSLMFFLPVSNFAADLTSAKDDIDTATSDISRDGNRAEPTRVANNFGLLVVVFGGY